ncbi:hypothetical protein CC1_21520 [Coprococcus catus GD/7]|uniref:Uncharacterized protein n=1 Tax=Coprococcus catus GD/7 TaxID=717962 RepID=D4J934_9FIRM|nr:hypothetical protein [Coprococcus catus]CBK80855.1 hypothetical protein CC1_21520 [Coprococcus catus GD/7]
MYIDLTKMTREEEVDYFITKIDDCDTKAYDDVLRGKKRIYDIPFKYRDRRMYVYACRNIRGMNIEWEGALEKKLLENCLLGDIIKRNEKYADINDGNSDLLYNVSAEDLKDIYLSYFVSGLF